VSTRTRTRSERDRRTIARIAERAAKDPEALFDDLSRLIIRTGVIWFSLGVLLVALPWLGSVVLP